MIHIQCAHTQANIASKKLHDCVMMSSESRMKYISISLLDQRVFVAVLYFSTCSPYTVDAMRLTYPAFPSG